MARSRKFQPCPDGCAANILQDSRENTEKMRHAGKEVRIGLSGQETKEARCVKSADVVRVNLFGVGRGEMSIESI